MHRCSWCNLNNPLYIKYHDEEWGKLNLEESSLFAMLILESFQAGLSWECVLNNKDIIRNKLKIKASINNARIFKKIESEYGSFKAYLMTFTKNTVLYETGLTTNYLSDVISLDLKKNGMKFVGSTIIYSYLQAIGVINSHDENCFMYGGV